MMATHKAGPNPSVDLYDLVYSCLARNADMSPSDIVEKIRSEHGVSISLSTAYRARSQFVRQRQQMNNVQPTATKIKQSAKQFVPSEKALRVREYMESHPEAMRMTPSLLIDAIKAETGLDVDYGTVANQRVWYTKRHSPTKGNDKTKAMASVSSNTSTAGPMTSSDPIISLETLRLLRDMVNMVGGKTVAKQFIDLLPE